MRVEVICVNDDFKHEKQPGTIHTKLPVDSLSAAKINGGTQDKITEQKLLKPHNSVTFSSGARLTKYPLNMAQRNEYIRDHHATIYMKETTRYS